MTDHTTVVTGGVDTHRDTHVAAALDERGGQLGVESFPATVRGYQTLFEWLRGFGVVERVGVEGTGCSGAGLSRHLQKKGVEVVEVDRPNRQLRRRSGKSDPVDAVAAARAAQSGQATAVAKTADGDVEKLRVLRMARASARHSRVKAINQLRALIVTAPDDLGTELAGLSAVMLPARCARFRIADPITDLGALKYAMRSLARRVVGLRAEIKDLDAIITTLVNQTAPELLARHGVGPDSAAVLLVAAGDNPERMQSEPAFACLRGVAPLEASSGPMIRHRLSRAGNRQANATLHSIELVRMVSHPDVSNASSPERSTTNSNQLALKGFTSGWISGAVGPRIERRCWTGVGGSRRGQGAARPARHPRPGQNGADTSPTPGGIMAKTPISADSHIVEPPNCYVDYIDPAWRDRAPRIERNSKGVENFVIEGLHNAIPIGMLAAAGMTPEEVKVMRRADFDEITHAAWDPDARIEAQDRDGVGAEVIFASVGMVLCSHPDYEYKRACMTAYNRWLAEFCAAQPKRIFGLAQCAVSSVDEAIEDFVAAKDAGMVGMMMTGNPQHEDYDHPDYDTLWECATELDLPVCFHILTSQDDDPSTALTSPRGHRANAFMNLVRGVQNILGLFVFGGVFERHPDLHMVVAEADAGWVPHWMYRSDHAAMRWGSAMSRTISKQPSEYVLSNCHFTFQDDETAYENPTMVDSDCLLWASDFPHTDSTYPRSQEILADHTAHLTEAERDRVLHDNAAKVFGLPH